MSALDLCFVEATDAIRAAVRHVLDGDCDEKLKKELLQWQESGVQGEREEKPIQEVPEYCCSTGTPIPFELVVRIHQQLKAHPLGRDLVFGVYSVEMYSFYFNGQILDQSICTSW